MKDRSQSSLIRTKRFKACGNGARADEKWTVAEAVRELKRLGVKRNVERGTGDKMYRDTIDCKDGGKNYRRRIPGAGGVAVPATAIPAGR